MSNSTISKDFSKWVYKNHRLASYMEIMEKLPKQVARKT
jgi:tRNA(Phe) wybutosine-synthesizing methylase Tyw3